MTVQYSIQKMVSDGTLSTIALGIQYLQRNDIYIRIAGEETPQSGAPNGYTWSFINNTTLKILPVVPNGVEVVVYRRTDVGAMYNVYSQNAQFDEATIDENNKQLLYIAQEYLEQGLPGAGVDSIEFLRDDGTNTYYRIKRTDGSYSNEFGVPSASSVTKALARESIRRSYAGAGYNLVDGSFEVGGTLVHANDVLLQESTGKAFSGPAGPVAAGTDPTIGGFVDRSGDVVTTFNTVADVDSNVVLGQRVVVREYSIGSKSGVLFFKVVASGTGVADGGKFINLPSSGLQLEQNIKLPCDPRAWGAVGNGDHVNADRDTSGLQGAVNYGSTYVNDGHYIINATTTIHNAVKSSSGAKLEYINTTGPCWSVTTAPVAIDLNEYSATILDNGAGRANTWSVVLNKVARSNIAVNVEPGDQYNAIYGALTASQKLDLKFGIQVTGNSFTCYLLGKLSRASILMESADCHIVEPSVIWSNERRWAVKLLAASTTIEGVQMVPGEEYGIYSDAADITHTQILDNYFDGNTKLQSEIPTGHMIYFTGNLRRSMIGSNRFFIPAKRSIHVGGRLESTPIIMNNFSNGDSADLGFGDIYLNSHQGSAIIGNSFIRDNLAAKTGSARAQPTQPPITVVASQNGEFDEPMFIMGNSLQGRNFYADSVYPASSAIITKSNHARIHNKNPVVTRYSDGEGLKCYKIQPLSAPQLDALPAGTIYTDSLNALGIADASNGSGYITTTRVQDVNNMSVTNFGKQEVITNVGRFHIIRTLVNGVWGAWRQI